MERDLDPGPGLAGGRLHRGVAAEDDQIGQRDLFAAGLALVELALDSLQGLQHTGQLLRLVDLPVLLRCKPDTRPVGAAAHVRAAERGRRGPGGRDQLTNGQPGIQDLFFQRLHVLVINQLVIDGRHRVLPDQIFLRDIRTQVTRFRTHVTMNQLEPGAGEGVRKLVRVLVKAPGNLLVGRVETQRQVRGEHGGLALSGRIVGVGNRGFGIPGHPLLRSGRALLQLPFVAEQVIEEGIAPPGGGAGPGDLRPSAYGVIAHAGPVAALPAHTLFLDGSRLGFGTDQGRVAGAVALAEGMAARDQGHGFVVVHGHALEGLANIMGGLQRIRLAVRSFRIDVDQAHLHGGEGVLQVAVAAVTFVLQPLALGTPVDILFRLPDIFTAESKAEGLEAHVLQGDVTGEYDQIGPGDTVAVFLFQGPQQPARTVQVDIVRPAVDRCETLRSRPATAAAVAHAIGARGMPGHANEQRTVVTEISRPPVHGILHQGGEILFQGLYIQFPERFPVIEFLSHGTGFGRMLVQDLQPQPVRPPIPGCHTAAGGMGERTFVTRYIFNGCGHSVPPPLFRTGFLDSASRREMQVLQPARVFILFLHAPL